MSQENVEVVRTWMQACSNAEGDVDAERQAQGRPARRDVPAGRGGVIIGLVEELR
jgi:hypothetical protein